MLQAITEILSSIWANSGFAAIFGSFADGGYKYLIMIAISCVLLYLAIVKKFEPLLLLPIAFGMLMANLPWGNVIHMDFFITESGHPDYGRVLLEGGLADILYMGVKLGV